MLVLNLDINSLENYVYDFTAKMRKEVERSVKLLAAQAHEYIRSKAQTELKSRKRSLSRSLIATRKSTRWHMGYHTSKIWTMD